MSEGLEALSALEKEALRYLLGGHDAKSIARELGLSVHTVNERLRVARRKLGVSSSREAARRLAAIEQRDPKFLVDKELGGAGAAIGGKDDGEPSERKGLNASIAWFLGGVLLMSLVAAALSFSSRLRENGLSPAQGRMAAAPVRTSESASTSAAREWAGLLDAQRWEESWEETGIQFKSQMGKDQWVSSIRPLRQPFGKMSSRALQSVTRSDSPPGKDAGEYEVVRFQTVFANKLDALETVIVSREGSVWKVDGYVIR